MVILELWLLPVNLLFGSATMWQASSLTTHSLTVMTCTTMDLKPTAKRTQMEASETVSQ